MDHRGLGVKRVRFCFSGQEGKDCGRRVTSRCDGFSLLVDAT